jgi:hypothetical protein
MSTNLTRIPDGTIRLTHPGYDRIYLGLYVEDDSVQGEVFACGDIVLSPEPCDVIEMELRQGDTSGDFTDEDAPGSDGPIDWHWEFTPTES